MNVEKPNFFIFKSTILAWKAKKKKLHYFPSWRHSRGNRGWDGWMAPPTRWTWVWVNSRSWWWTGRPGVLQFMRSQSWTRLSDWTELNWYWSGLSCPPPGDLPDLGIEPVSPALQVGSLPLSHQGSPRFYISRNKTFSIYWKKFHKDDKDLLPLTYREAIQLFVFF